MSYLTRRDGRYQYRRRFPVEVAAVVGRAEFRKALGTADLKQAKQQAHRLSVEFDRICSEAVAGGLPEAPQTAQEQALPAGAGVAQPQPKEPAEAILAAMQHAAKVIARDALELQGQPRWKQELEWRKQALRAHLQGQMPAQVAIAPAVAAAALRSLEAVEQGDVLALQAALGAGLNVPGNDGRPELQPAGLVHADEFQTALDGYCARVTPGRGKIVRSLCAKVLEWPATQEQQVQRIMLYCEAKLAAGGKETAVHTQAAGLITVLRELPGWESAKLPRNSATARVVRSGSGMQRDARPPMPLSVLRQMLDVFKSDAAPEDFAAIRLLALYGLRPSELLQERSEALAEREDVLGKKALVFKAALSGGKNSSARRDLAVHPGDADLFRQVLRACPIPEGADAVRKAQLLRRRVTSLQGKVQRRLDALGLAERERQGLSLYSLRHLCADLLRAVQADHHELQAIMGHASAGSKATSVYGGRQPLERQRQILDKVREHIDGTGATA